MQFFLAHILQLVYSDLAGTVVPYLFYKTVFVLHHQFPMFAPVFSSPASVLQNCQLQIIFQAFLHGSVQGHLLFEA